MCCLESHLLCCGCTVNCWCVPCTVASTGKAPGAPGLLLVAGQPPIATTSPVGWRGLIIFRWNGWASAVLCLSCVLDNRQLHASHSVVRLCVWKAKSLFSSWDGVSQPPTVRTFHCMVCLLLLVSMAACSAGEVAGGNGQSGTVRLLHAEETVEGSVHHVARAGKHTHNGNATRVV